jgi:hypothetical protein
MRFLVKKKLLEQVEVDSEGETALRGFVGGIANVMQKI